MSDPYNQYGQNYTRKGTGSSKAIHHQHLNTVSLRATDHHTARIPSDLHRQEASSMDSRAVNTEPMTPAILRATQDTSMLYHIASSALVTNL